MRAAIVVSADGLPMAASPGVSDALADQLSAATSGLVSLARGTAQLLGSGPVAQTIVEMADGYLFVTRIGDGAALAMHADRQCDIGKVGYEMTMLAAPGRARVTPAARAGRRPVTPAASRTLAAPGPRATAGWCRCTPSPAAAPARPAATCRSSPWSPRPGARRATCRRSTA